MWRVERRDYDGQASMWSSCRRAERESDLIRCVFFRDIGGPAYVSVLTENNIIAISEHYCMEILVNIRSVGLGKSTRARRLSAEGEVKKVDEAGAWAAPFFLFDRAESRREGVRLGSRLHRFMLREHLT